MQAGSLCIGICAVLLFSSCQENVPETIPESNGYDLIAANETEQTAITETISTYLQALEHKSYSELQLCTSSEFPLCQNETAFYDVTTELESASLEKIDFENFQRQGDHVLVTVDYTLTYTGSFTDIDGSSQAPGSYSHKELFGLTMTDGSYLIDSAVKTGAG